MKLHLLSAYRDHPALDQLIECGSADRVGRHELTSSPDEADAILFVENAQFSDYLYRELLKHELIAAYPDKIFMYNEADKPWATLPGLYCSMPDTAFEYDHQVAFPYVQTPNPYVSQINDWELEKRWLYSFVGSVSHRCRKDVLALGTQCDGVVDTSEFDTWHSEGTDRLSQELKFAEHMARSQFVLCPRGIGTSSARLFETMEAGIAPVIISDHWVPTEHIDWSFAVQVPENSVDTIPDVLEAIADESADRGRAARDAWASAYSADTLFNTAAESIAYLLDIKESARPGAIRNWRGTRQFVVSKNHELRTTARQILDRLQPDKAA